MVVEPLPIVEADITLLPPADGGREHALVRMDTSHYRPHIVLGSPDQRLAKLQGRTLVEEYLGVEVLQAQDVIKPGEQARVSMRLAYWPAPGYSGVVPGATFTVREGAKIVAYGTILSRRDP
jgi:hypothetical protein